MRCLLGPWVSPHPWTQTHHDRGSAWRGGGEGGEARGGEGGGGGEVQSMGSTYRHIRELGQSDFLDIVKIMGLRYIGHGSTDQVVFC